MKLQKAAYALIITAALLASACHGPSRRGGYETPKDKIELRIVPQDAVIIVDDMLVGNAFNFPTLELEPGLHKIEIRREGYEPFRGTLNAGQTLVLEVELKKIGEE